MPGELLWVAYAPVGAKGSDDGDDCLRTGALYCPEFLVY